MSFDEIYAENTSGYSEYLSVIDDPWLERSNISLDQLPTTYIWYPPPLVQIIVSVISAPPHSTTARIELIIYLAR